MLTTGQARDNSVDHVCLACEHSGKCSPCHPSTSREAGNLSATAWHAIPAVRHGSFSGGLSWPTVPTPRRKPSGHEKEAIVAAGKITAMQLASQSTEVEKAERQALGVISRTVSRNGSASWTLVKRYSTSRRFVRLQERRLNACLLMNENDHARVILTPASNAQTKVAGREQELQGI